MNKGLRLSMNGIDFVDDSKTDAIILPVVGEAVLLLLPSSYNRTA